MNALLSADEKFPWGRMAKDLIDRPGHRPLRLKLKVRGAVQGVGFRPFVFRLAEELVLAGRVMNSAQGVLIEVEGPRPQLEQFLLRLDADKPPRSSLQSLEASWLDPVGYDSFEIRPSDAQGEKSALVMPDIATCPDCLREIFDPANRRYRYPFTNCTNCGPRFSLVESLPYDRTNTSMKAFVLCPQCQTEYDDPRDRRFHAQPNACPVCGPHLELWDHEGRALFGTNSVRQDTPESVERRNDPRSHERGCGALVAAAEALRQGRIVAVKGLGGFHLMVAADNDRAVRRLRALKHREEKPFALMFPSLAAVRAHCAVSNLEERVLSSPEAPIVLLKRAKNDPPTADYASRITHHASGATANGQRPISPSVAPANPCLGIMLPSTPLHHLLLAELGFPVVATSGNLSDEPICTDNREALERLAGIADLFLVHDRPIVRHVDDSIVRVTMGRELVLRRARGYAPLPILLKSESQNPKSEVVLAVGAHLKNAIALSVQEQVFVSQHIGDLETEPAWTAFQRVIEDLERLYDSQPFTLAADLHPDYLSTQYARERVAKANRSPADPNPACAQPRRAGTDSLCGDQRPKGTGHQKGKPRWIGVQHHFAHVLSCMAENELEPPVLGIAWDGTGLGMDGTIWGGEFLLVTDGGFERLACLRPFRLPGGDAAVREPRRAALAVLYEILGETVFSRRDLLPVQSFSATELAALQGMLRNGVNSPLTSSAGRLFDAVASLIGLRQRTRFEGQAAMELEFALEGIRENQAYPPMRNAECRARNETDAVITATSPIPDRRSPLILDWEPMIRAILADLNGGTSASVISAKFHNTLAEGMVAVAKHVGEPRVALSGGCFQNCYLTERVVRRLQEEGFRPYWHQRVPPNDGGIALGQIVAALRAVKSSGKSQRTEVVPEGGALLPRPSVEVIGTSGGTGRFPSWEG